MTTTTKLLNFKTLTLGAVLLGAATLAAALPGNAQAQQNVIHLVVPYGTGAVQDTIARAISDDLGRELGASIVVENRAGAGGTVGTALVARSKPDGNTLVLAAASHNIAGYMYKNLSYRPYEDFVGVANLGNVGYILMVSAKLDVKNTAEFIQTIKSKPGGYDYASAGNGSATHLDMASLLAATGLQMQHIPMKSTGDAVNELLAGRVAAIAPASIAALPFRNDPRVRMIAYMGPKRSRFAPELPTLAESGVPNYRFDSWMGILAPAAIPAERRNQINAAVNKIMTNPKVQERLAALGVETAPSTPQQFQDLLAADWKAAEKLVADSGAKIE